eukprot:gene2749-5415_t
MASIETVQTGGPLGNNTRPSRIDPRSDESILCRWWKPACITAWVFFISYEVSICLDQMLNPYPLCPHSDVDYGYWYWFTNHLVLGGFILTWIMLFTKIVQMKAGPLRVPYLTAFNIVSMGTLATTMAVVWNWGGVCIDVLGVASPAAIWGEWIACGPLLIFIIVTVVDKPYLTKTDWLLIISFWICLVTGFLIIPYQPYGWGVFWLVISCLTYLPLLYLPCYVGKCPSVYSDGLDYSTIPTEENELNLTHAHLKRYNLSVWLTIILPLYTINYLVAWAGGIDAATTIAIYQVLSVLTKGLFTALCMDSHVDVLMETQRAVERRANAARRAFLKYIFHEVRTPLNSLTMGIEILQLSESLSAEDKETLLMMKGASEFMSDTLNDVLSMQKIEERKLELDLSPFCIKDAISKVFLSLRGASTSKNISLLMNIPDDVPLKVIGDRYRVEHMISNLLSNAIKFSPDNSTVEVCVSCGLRRFVNGCTVIDITIAITDHGIGISEENQKKLFSSFVQIRPGALQQGQGSGLGLSLCKEIVTLHGGTINVKSIEGQGSTFSFTIPYIIFNLPEIDLERGEFKSSSMVAPILEHNNNNNNNSTIAIFETSNSINEVNSINIQQKLFNNSNKSFPGVLVVDDAESNRKMLMMLLKKNGVEAATADNGQKALDMIRDDMNAYKLIFMDNLMPILNGVDATRILRQEGFRYLIVGATGNVLEDDIKEYLNAGADFIIGKPLKIHQLEMIIRHVRENGPESQLNMKLVEHANRLNWSSWGLKAGLLGDLGLWS